MHITMSTISGTVHLTLRPHCTDHVIQALQTTVVIDNANYDKDELFDFMPLSLVNCQCTAYDPTIMVASDASGLVEIVAVQDIGPFGPQREYRFNRAVHGKLVLSYEAAVPRHDPFARNPGFALARHDHGITGAGLTFLLLPEGEHVYTVDFDLTELDGDATAIAGRLKGGFTGTYTAEYLKNIYYAMGDLHEYRKDGSKLHIFTLDDNGTFFDDLANVAQVYYDYISAFFRDTSDAYNIILYPSRRAKLTGTALFGVCYLGLGNNLIHSITEIENVLAHELTHNWCYLQGDEMMNNLFTEGTAEFYSCYMQYHTGQTDLDGYVAAVNTKLRGCYSHPLARTESYETIYHKSWSHAFCQRIPYIKGVMMFLQLDALIRRCSDKRQSLDDLVRQVATAASTGTPLTYEAFQQLANQMTDGKAQAVLDAAKAPGLAPLPHDFFGDGYELVRTTIPLACEGYDPTVRFTDSIIRGLIPGSNAERAGLRNGDKILQMIADDGDTSLIPVQITVERNGKTLDFTYYACGDPAECWQYQKA